MPIAYPRTSSGWPIVTSTFLPWKTVTKQEVNRNAFRLASIGPVSAVLPIQYAVADPYDHSFLDENPTPGVSMHAFVEMMLGSGDYGILGEVSGMMALERGYSGEPRMYVPYEATFPASSFVGYWGGAPNGTVLSRSNVTDPSHGLLWYGPYSFLSPGIYRVGFLLKTTSLSPLNRLSLFASGSAGALSLSPPLIVSGNNFTRANAWTQFNLTVNINNSYVGVEYVGTASLWNGTISLGAVHVEQLMAGVPPVPT